MEMNTETGIIHAMSIDGDGMGHALMGDQMAHALEHQKLLWVHLDAGNQASKVWIEHHAPDLDPIVPEALVAEETHPRLLSINDGILLILRGINHNPGAEPEDMVSIRLWADKHKIISLQMRNLRAVEDIKTGLALGKGPRNTGGFICMLVASLIERMEPILSDLDDRIADIEELVMENPDKSERQEISNIRKEAITFRRYIAPQREVLGGLRTLENPLFDVKNKRRLQEAHDRAIRYVEDLDLERERAQIIKDELSTALSDRLNKNLYILSVVAAIFLPLTFITGLLGINVAGIPGADNPKAFGIVLGIVAMIIFAQVAVFKRLKWLEE